MCVQAGPVAWSALQAAKNQLIHEKPETFDRMTKIIANCKISGALHKGRLDALGERRSILRDGWKMMGSMQSNKHALITGVFESDVNEIRSKAMQRVHIHQELSTTSLRLPNQMKVRT